MDLVGEVKKKKEFYGLPDSVIKRALAESKDDVKDARSLLRKYFGVFLTNRVLKGKDDLLKIHMSSKKRDYQKFYGEIFGGIGEDVGYGVRMRRLLSSVGSVVDLGCGVNGFSYGYLPGGVSYVGVEAAGQLVGLMNSYFELEGLDGKAVCLDLFDIDSVLDILKKAKKPRVVFMFQVVDALENLERNFSKKFILDVSKECEWIILSLPTESLGGRKKFAVRRRWLKDFLDKEFVAEKDFVLNGERIICFHK